MSEESAIDHLERLVISEARNADNSARMETYHEALYSPAGANALKYLKETRGLVDSTIKHFKLGFVHNPYPQDYSAKGYISIPYINPGGVFDIRFRRGPDIEESRPKYWQPAGSTQTIYNVDELDARNKEIVICEGEGDVWAAWQCGLPAVGYPGVKSVEHYHRHLYEGFERVFICGDGDQAGRGFNEELAKMLRNGYIIAVPDDLDIADYMLKHGVQKTKNLIYGK